ncbi:MAG TPA: ChbG/HpnK family deacetylase [Chloroflexota bacterium]|nr:ChbG/HpnK family deacetylase [Chloroflexota bacterium]
MIEDQSETIAKRLIVNADDFGRSIGVNRGTITAHEKGIVTSASMMVRWDAAFEAADYARRNRRLDLGLHFDAGEWVYRDGAWQAVYTVVDLGDRAAIATELERQLDAFRALVGRPPSHLDSHQHVHRHEPARSVLTETAAALGVVLRGCEPAIRYRGEFYGQSGRGEPLPDSISVERLLEILATLSPGVTELGCHPGEASDLDSTYQDERVQEVKALCDPRIRRALQDNCITLCSFPELAED